MFHILLPRKQRHKEVNHSEIILNICNLSPKVLLLTFVKKWSLKRGYTGAGKAPKDTLGKRPSLTSAEEVKIRLKIKDLPCFVQRNYQITWFSMPVLSVRAIPCPPKQQLKSCACQQPIVKTKILFKNTVVNQALSKFIFFFCILVDLNAWCFWSALKILVPMIS